MTTATRTRAHFLIKRDGWWKLAPIISENRDFNPDSSSLRGRAYDGPSMPSVGRLPEPFRTHFCEQAWSGRLSYVVFSYATPIAYRFHDDDGDDRWIVPPVRYSVTTSSHQSKVATAMAGEPS